MAHLLQDLNITTDLDTLYLQNSSVLSSFQQYKDNPSLSGNVATVKGIVDFLVLNYIENSSVLSDLQQFIDNPELSGKVVSAIGILNYLSSNYVKQNKKDITGKIGTEAVDYIKMIDQTEDIEVPGYGCYQLMAISATDNWINIGTELPENIEGRLKLCDGV